MTWPQAFTYLVDHLPTIIGAIFAGIVMVRQNTNMRVVRSIDATTSQTHHDVRNGLPAKIASTVASQLADKLPWDGIERRSGTERRQP